MIGVLSESEASPHLPDEAKAPITESIRFLAERLATVAALVDPSTPTINGANLLPAGALKTGPARTMLQDIAKGLARRIPLTKLIELDADIRPYLASLMVAAMHKAGDTIVVPTDLKIRPITTENFEALLQSQAGESYDNYGRLA